MQLALTVSPLFIHIHNARHNQNSGIFKSSAVFRFLSNILYSTWKRAPGHNFFCRTLDFLAHFIYLAGF